MVHKVDSDSDSYLLHLHLCSVPQCIKKIKRADRRGSESVTEEKFAIHFSGDVVLMGCELPCKVQVLLFLKSGKNTLWIPDSLGCVIRLDIPLTNHSYCNVHSMCYWRCAIVWRWCLFVFFFVDSVFPHRCDCSRQSRHKRHGYYHLGLCLL